MWFLFAGLKVCAKAVSNYLSTGDSGLGLGAHCNKRQLP